MYLSWDRIQLSSIVEPPGKVSRKETGAQEEGRPGGKGGLGVRVGHPGKVHSLVHCHLGFRVLSDRLVLHAMGK